MTLAAWLCVIAGIVLVTKTIVTAMLNRRTLRFLANRQAALSAQLTAGLLSRPLLEIQAKASQDVAFVLTLGTQAATVGIFGGGFGCDSRCRAGVRLGPRGHRRGMRDRRPGPGQDPGVA